MLVLIATVVAQAVPAEDQLLGNLDAAKSYDYCGWAHDGGGDRSLMPDVSAYVGAESKITDRQLLPSAVVIDAGMRVATESPDKPACEEMLSTGRSVVASARKRNTKNVRRQARFKKSRDKSIAAVQKEISALWKEDQVARLVYMQTKTGSRGDAWDWAHSIATADTIVVDERSAHLLRNLLEEYEWIDIDRFTRDISQQAWTLVQHGDAHVDLQQLALSRMEPYLQTGGVLKRNYAYLWDRVAVNTGELQRYGTQPDWSSCVDGMLSLVPMEDPEKVDARRSSMRLGPVQNDLEQMSHQTCPAKPKADAVQ